MNRSEFWDETVLNLCRSGVTRIDPKVAAEHLVKLADEILKLRDDRQSKGKHEEKK